MRLERSAHEHRTCLAGGVAADRDRQVDGRRIGASEFVPALRAEGGSIDALASKQPQCPGVRYALGFASCAVGDNPALPERGEDRFAQDGVGTQNGPRYTLRFCRAFDDAHLAKRSERGGWRIGIGPEVIAGEIDMLPTER